MKKALCTRCRAKSRAQSGKQRWCSECRNEWMRLNRPSYSEYTEEQRIRANARSYLSTYIRRGKVKVPAAPPGLRASPRWKRYDLPLNVTWEFVKI